MNDVLDDQASLRDGRYEGGDESFLIELRIDVGGSGVISGDLFRADTPGHEHLSSVRTAAGTDVALPSGTWPARWDTYQGRSSTGAIAVEPHVGDGDAATVRLRLDQSLNGLPAATDLVADVRWKSAEFRRLGLETEIEEDVHHPGAAVQLDGREITFEDCLRRAGFEISAIGRRTRIRRQPDGWQWDESVVHGVLDVLMKRAAQTRLDLPAWQVHLLMLAYPVREGLYGVMFDLAQILPRQGCAIFVDEIRRRTPLAEHNRRIIHTMTHEVGHAFNLAHRFERVLGRADSTSFMNYAHRYVGGEKEYWNRFSYGFDPDELIFMRHGPRAEVMPGTAPFHSVPYWDTGGGAPADVVPAGPAAGLELSLETPANQGAFEFGQPVFLQVSLRNTGRAPVTLPGHALDIKAGYLEILVQRLPDDSRSAAAEAARSFVPVSQRCMDPGADPTDLLPEGAPLRDNVNLTYGADGFTMDRPGRYRVTPLLSVAGGPSGSAVRVVQGESLTVQVVRPTNRRDERHAERLFQPEVGAWFALGGSAALSGAHAEVSAIRAERPTGDGWTDPIAAAITRTLGLHASRSYLRLGKDGFEPTPPDRDGAATLLRGLLADPGIRRCFDEYTVERTMRLARSLAGEPA